MGQGRPGGNKWDAGARKPCSKKPNDHTKSLREEISSRPKEVQQA